MPRRKRPFTPFTGPLMPVPSLPLPEATTLRELGLPFTETELTHVRTAMAMYKASRQPQLTYDGWKIIGLALNMGEVRSKQHARGVVHSRGPYGQALRQFLNATGFAFINSGVRQRLRDIIKHLEEVDAWREGLLATDRAHLNNPIDVWERFREDQATGKTRVKRQLPVTRQRRGYPSQLEEMQALYDVKEALEERVYMLEVELKRMIDATPPETLRRWPDDLLRKNFAKLPQRVQDALHARLYPKRK